MTLRTTLVRTATLCVLSGVGVGLAATGATAAPLDHAATAATAAAPVVASPQRNDLGKKRWMESEAVLDGSTLYAQTTTHAGERLRGFKGCVSVSYISGSGAVLDISHTEQYGVDGTAVGNSTRIEAWSEAVSADIAANTVRLVIHHWVCG